MKKKLFLDDIRNPEDCVIYMHTRIGTKNPIYIEDGWNVARNFEEFERAVKKEHPDIISFDHDLAQEHYTPEEYWTDYDASKEYQDSREYKEKTGADCAKWLKTYCAATGLPLPECWVHSMNPVGADNIKHILKQ